jgi:DNA invertase Pin-like site-specific DNA recombinase
MTAIGYARVSTTGQDLTIQVEALKAAGCDVIRKEKTRGTTTRGRTDLASVLDFIREGDVVVVARINRRSAEHRAHAQSPWRCLGRDKTGHWAACHSHAADSCS